MRQVTLYRWRREGIGWQDLLSEALRLGAGAPIVAVVYGARKAWLAAVGMSGTLDPMLDDPRVFELRAFDGVNEWRWLAGPEQGRGAWVTEHSREAPAGWLPVSPAPPGTRAKDGDTLLWGKVTSAGQDHATLATARVGSIRIPHTAAIGGRVALRVREYLGSVDKHGNVGLVEERILGFQNIEVER
jgi:CRISPR-associated protein (TIGR03984 family)